MKLSTTSCVLALALTVSGCASKPPPRTAYTGADNIGAVSADMLIGNWTVRVLNPVDGEQGTISDASYTPDGRVVMNASPSRQGINWALKMTGSWQLDGELVTQTLESIEETSGSTLGALLTPLMSAFKNNASGSANIYEASAERVVLVSQANGQALEYTRKP